MLPAVQLVVKMEEEVVDKVGKVEIEDKEDKEEDKEDKEDKEEEEDKTKVEEENGKVHNKIGIN